MNCPICNAIPTPQTLAGFDVFACGCGFIFAVAAKNTSAPELYDEDWSKDTTHPTYMNVGGRFVGRNVWKQRQLLHRLRRFRQSNRILDIGCSAAFFLKLAKDMGWSVQGVEIAAWAAKFSQAELGVPVFQGTLQQAAFADGSFDVAFSSHVLEHVGEPKGFVAEVGRVLRPGGAVVITVPTQFRSPMYKFFREWYGEGPPRHVSFFDRKSLTRLLEDSGFKVIHCGYNIELQLLLNRLRKGPAGRGAAGARDLSQPAQAPEQGAGLAVRFVKNLANGLGGCAGVSDEIRVIAIKPGR